MTDIYNSLARAIAKAGFYTNGVEDHGTWHRTCICSKRLADGRLSGNSFWVSRLPSGWYLGVWGGSLYRIADENKVAELCISWLSREHNGTKWDFDDQVKQDFGLVEVSEKEFDTEAGIT